MPAETNIAATAALLADPTRMLMVTALLDGRALPAGELAYAAGISPQTASAHLSKLMGGGFLNLEKEGRHRYYRLSGGHIAEAIERLAAIHPPGPVRRKALSPEARALRLARCCYDHLAGRLGVAVTQQLCAKELIVSAPEKRFEITARGYDWFTELGLDVCAIKPGRRGLARPCLDWTERFHHLGGPLGVQLLALLCDKRWLQRRPNSRAVHVTPLGRRELSRQLGISESLWRTGD